MQVKFTRVLISIFFALALVSLAPAAEANVTINHKVMDEDGNALRGGTIALTHVGHETALYRARDNSNNGMVEFGFEDNDQNLNTDLVAWHYDSNGHLQHRELWVLRDGKLQKTNDLLLDYGPSESSYCSPSCDAPSSVTGSNPGWTIPAFILLLLILL
ncbi:hypothetical protein ACFL17_00510 [Pseudomonadota bacterium]